MSNQPSTLYVVVAPSDATDLPNGRCRSIYVGTGGNIALQHADTGASATFVDVGSGTVLPVGATRVLVTGTTASNIIALY